MTAPAHNQHLVSASRPPRRPPHLVMGLIVGALVGFSIGTLLVLVVNERSLTGSRDELFTYLFGLPGLLSVPGGVLGAFAAIARYADDADTPVRLDERGNPVVDARLASSTGQADDPHAGARAEQAQPRA
jgi:hypothetical protein